MTKQEIYKSEQSNDKDIILYLEGSDFDLYSEEHIAEIEWKLNHRPRKSLGYLTPLEYFKKLYNFDFRSRCTSI